MKNIRTGVFETNSSSTHSVSIKYSQDLSKSMNDFDFNIVDDKIQIKLGSFGWEKCTYSNASTKLSYIYTFLENVIHPPTMYGDRQMAERISRELIMDICYPLGISYETFRKYESGDGTVDVEGLIKNINTKDGEKNRLIKFLNISTYKELKLTVDRIVHEYTGYDFKIIKVDEKGRLNTGSIDHQSESMLILEGVFDTDGDIINFIFNPESILQTSNDNSCDCSWD